MQTQSTIRSLLAQAGVRPTKRLGQHFLIDGNLMRKLVAAAEIRSSDVVIEIGCGTGSLTEELARVAGAVVAVEVDRRLVDLAQTQLADRRNVRLLHCDVLESKSRLEPTVRQAVAEARQRLGGRALLVANLPYQVASPLIVDVLIDMPEIERLCVTVQKEVGDRLLASPGGKDYGPLTVIVQTLTDVHRIAAAPAQAFWPRPAVASVMLQIDPNSERHRAIANVHHFASVVRSCFRHRRKTLAYNLAKAYGAKTAEEVLGAGGIEPRARPEQIIPDNWLELTRRLDTGG